jgi:hypothetical protein
MDALSVRNDLPAFPLLLASIVLTVLCLLLLSAYRDRLRSHIERGCSDRAFWISFVSVAGVLTLFFTDLQPHVFPWGGMDRYFVRAINLLSHGVFGYGTVPTAIFPPGYSFLLLPALLLLGETRWAFFLTNVALMVAFAIVLRLVLVRLGASRQTANLLTLLVAFYPNRLLWTLLPFSDVPFSLLYGTAFALLMLRFLRGGGFASALGIGVVAGAATLVRSNGLVLFLPLFIGIVAGKSGERRLRVRQSLAALGLFLLLLTPWAVRNYHLFGRLVPGSTNAGINIAIGNNPSAPVTHNYYIDSVWADSSDWVPVGGVHWNEAQRDSFFGHLGTTYAEEHPWDFALRGLKKLQLTFQSDNFSFGLLSTYTNATTVVYAATRDSRLPRWLVGFSAAMVGTALTLLLILNGTFYYLLVIGSLYLLSSRHALLPPTLRWVVLLIVGGVAAMVVATFGLSRYKEPVEIVLMLSCIAEVLLRFTPHRAVTPPDHPGVSGSLT